MTLTFLNSILQKTYPNTLMETFDVTNLFCNILHKLRKQVVSFWIEKYPKILHPRFNEKFITDGIEQILNNNYFQFDYKNCIQTLGMAMAPTYAKLTLEEDQYEIIGKNTATI